MKEIITIANQKGGVGKSTTASLLGLGLIKKGYRVLFIDLDPQENLSFNLGTKPTGLTSLEVLTGTATIEEAIQTTDMADVIPAGISLVSVEALVKETGKEYKLKEALEPILDKYDYVILDTPPALSLLTVNALTSSTSVIIPAQADAFSIQGISRFIETLSAVKKYCNPGLKVKGILLTRYNGRATLSKNIAESLEETAKQLNSKLFKTTIRECITIKESQVMQTNLYEYAPKSNASIDYMALVEEVLND